MNVRKYFGVLQPNTGIMFRQIIRETILGFMFWAIFQALAPMIWFYPLNELEISGYESFAVFLLSPMLLAVGIIQTFLQSRAAVCTLRLISLASLGSFQAPSTLTRLIMVALGCFSSMLVFTMSMYSHQKYRTLTLWGHILGLFAFLVSRIWFCSFVPLWWTATTNSIFVSICAIATVDKIIFEENLIMVPPSKPSSVENKPNWLLTSVGFGSLLFLIHWIFGDVSVVSRWSVSSYPDTGPSPYPSGFVVLLGLGLGVVLSPYSTVTRGSLWWVFGTISFLALYYLQTWQAFTGGVMLAVYTMSIYPDIVDRVTLCPPVRTITLSLLVWLAEVFFSVWTVAYNFVPGGVYTREHTDWLIAFVMLSIGAASLSRRPPVSYSHTAFNAVGNSKMPCKQTKSVLLLLLLLGAAGFVSRYHKQVQHPHKTNPQRDFTAAIWTYHFGYDNKGWPSMERAAQMLNDTGADVITLLESDASKLFLGNNDLAMWLSESLSMYVDFGPSTRDHTWGNLILSKYPFVKSTHHLLPSPQGELAPAVTATVNMSGVLVDFVVTHMGNDRDALDRKLQSEFLAEELRNAVNPVVFLGYVTSQPGSPAYNTLIEQGKVKDIDPSDKERWCEYIMYRNLIRLGYARISHGGLSDTEIQMARFRIPNDIQDFKDNERTVTSDAKVKADTKFTPRFGKYRSGHNWKEVHAYHMSTPKYFI